MLIAALLFLAGVVINLFSNAVEGPLKQWLGEGQYARYLFVAMGIFLVLAVAAYLYDHRSGMAALEKGEAPPVDPALDRHNRQVFIRGMRLRIQERLESAPKLIPLQLAERAPTTGE